MGVDDLDLVLGGLGWSRVAPGGLGWAWVASRHTASGLLPPVASRGLQWPPGLVAGCALPWLGHARPWLPVPCHGILGTPANLSSVFLYLTSASGNVMKLLKKLN